MIPLLSLTRAAIIGWTTMAVLPLEIAFDLIQDEFTQYAADKGMRRFGTISSARGRPLGEIDLDYSPVQLEDTFAAEDEKALAAV